MTRVTWIGHSTVLIETAARRLLTDPVLGARVGPVRRRSGRAQVELRALDAVLVSHLHHDHLDMPSLRLLRRHVPILVPTGGGPLLRANGFDDVRELDAGGATDVGGIAVRAVPALHDGRRLPFGPVAPALGYVIDGDHRIYFAGDTDLFSGMADIAEDLDLAIVPVGGWGPTLRGGHMDPVRAAASLGLLKPRAALAIHWGTLWPMGLGRVRRDRFELPARRFVEEARRVAPEVTVRLVEPGGHLDLAAGPGPDRPGPHGTHGARD